MKDKMNEKLIVALDVATFDEAKKIIDALAPAVEIFKVGSQLFTACGPVSVRYILAKGKKVFLDLKYHDIPNTVANAVAAAVALGEMGHDVLNDKGEKLAHKGELFMLTLHTVGGKEMLLAAAQAAQKQADRLKIKKPFLVGITVLTSEAKNDNIRDLVLARARLAKDAGLDGVVCASEEAAWVRKEFGKDFVIVTPGIRPAGSSAGDQKRVTTPTDAIKNGSNFLVVGRPIVEAADPLKAAKDVLEEIRAVKI